MKTGLLENERLVFERKIRKQNRYGFYFGAMLVLTSKRLLHVEDGKVKWAIQLQYLEGIIKKTDDEGDLLIHVKDREDLRYYCRNSDREFIIKNIAECFY